MSPVLILGFLKLFGVSGAYADVSGITFSGGVSDITSKILCPIAVAMFYILMALSVIMIIYAGFLYVTGGDNAERVSSAHKTLAYAAAGIIVAILAKSVPSIVASIVGASSVSGGC